MSTHPIDAVFDVAQSHEGLNWLSSGKNRTLRETCMWCLAECAHSSGVEFKIYIGNITKTLQIVWACTSADLERISKSHPLSNLIEFGAEAISMIAIREFTPYTAFSRAATKTGFDYYLTQNRDPNQIFTKNDARLEISGILKESDSREVFRRVRAKQKQTTASDSMSIPAFVVVVEFSVPKAHMELRNV